MFILPNGKPIDRDMLEMAMEDVDRAHQYYLNTQTGNVLFFSEFDSSSDERKRFSEERESDEYIPVERIPSRESYQWMQDFVEQVIVPKDRHAAEKLSIARMGKGAFRRFKDVLNSLDNEHVQKWHAWKDEKRYEAMKQWLDSLPEPILEQ